MTTTTYKPTRAIGAMKAQVAPTLTRRDFLSADGEIFRLQGLVAAYNRNQKQVKAAYQRTVIQKAIRRAQAELRLARRNHRLQEAV